MCPLDVRPHVELLFECALQRQAQKLRGLAEVDGAHFTRGNHLQRVLQVPRLQEETISSLKRLRAELCVDVCETPEVYLVVFNFERTRESCGERYRARDARHHDLTVGRYFHGAICIELNHLISEVVVSRQRPLVGLPHGRVGRAHRVRQQKALHALGVDEVCRVLGPTGRVRPIKVLGALDDRPLTELDEPPVGGDRVDLHRSVLDVAVPRTPMRDVVGRLVLQVDHGPTAEAQRRAAPHRGVDVLEGLRQSNPERAVRGEVQGLVGRPNGIPVERVALEPGRHGGEDEALGPGTNLIRRQEIELVVRRDQPPIGRNHLPVVLEDVPGKGVSRRHPGCEAALVVDVDDAIEHRQIDTRDMKLVRGM